MTRLRFDLRFKSDWLRSLDIPVEVRTADFHLVRRATASDKIEVGPGRYVVTAVLPAGQELTSVIDATGDSLTVPLEPDEEPVEDGQELSHYFAMQRLPTISKRSPAASVKRAFARSARAVASYLPQGVSNYVERATAPQAKLRFFKGNVLAGKASVIEPPVQVKRQSDAIRVIEIPPSDAPRFVQLISPGKAPLNLALPSSEQCGCRIVARQEAERYWVEVHLANEEADLLLSYTQNRLSDQEARVAENLLRRKMVDPIAAAVGSYALLRRNDLSRLHDWTSNLSNRTSIADGPAILGEHLARSGRSAEALDAFLMVESRGLPAFTDGVRFLFDRLKLYALTGEGLSSDKRERAAALFAAIEPFASNLDTDKAVTTFPGASPDTPNAAVMATLPDGLAIDLSG